MILARIGNGTPRCAGVRSEEDFASHSADLEAVPGRRSNLDQFRLVRSERGHGRWHEVADRVSIEVRRALTLHGVRHTVLDRNPDHATLHTDTQWSTRRLDAGPRSSAILGEERTRRVDDVSLFRRRERSGPW